MLVVNAGGAEGGPVTAGWSDRQGGTAAMGILLK
jgi:hypothetical protein